LVSQSRSDSGKSVFATKKAVLRSLLNPEKFLCARKVQKTVRESIFEETKKRISDWGLKSRVYYHENNSDLKLWVKDSMFLFSGMDDPEKLKSITGITSAVVEEVTEFTQDDIDQINLRIRGDTPSYKQIIAMYNRIDENHWIKSFEDDPPEGWTFHSSTYLDNPFIDEEYRQVLEGYRHTNKYYYDVYTLGLWGQMSKDNKFMYAFDREQHVSECQMDEELSVRLSFDFNIEPFVCTIYQKPDDDTVNVLDRVRLDNSDIFQVCDRIKAKYHDAFFIVTGDKSGGNRTGTARGTTSYWHIIRDELDLSDAQINLRVKNLDLIASRVLCNSALQHKNVNIHPDLTELIKDCTFATVDDRGVLVKDRKKTWIVTGKQSNLGS
jgi:phage terminase large subunit